MKKRGFFADLLWMLFTPLKDQFYCFGCSEHIHRRDRDEHKRMGHDIQFYDEQYYTNCERYCEDSCCKPKRR